MPSVPIAPTGLPVEAVVADVVDALSERGAAVLVAPPGAGKTTVMLTLAGLLPRLGGSVSVNGQVLPSGNPGKTNSSGVVLVPDNRALFGGLTVAETLTLSQRKGGVTADQIATGKGEHDENFPVASWLLRPDARAPVLAYYRFARAADDISDHPTASAADKLRLLGAMRAGLAGAGDPRAMALGAVCRARGIPLAHPDELLDAFVHDVAVTRYADWDDLIAYCRMSAMPVGRFVLDVHGEDHVAGLQPVGGRAGPHDRRAADEEDVAGVDDLRVGHDHDGRLLFVQQRHEAADQALPVVTGLDVRRTGRVAMQAHRHHVARPTAVLEEVAHRLVHQPQRLLCWAFSPNVLKSKVSRQRGKPN